MMDEFKIFWLLKDDSMLRYLMVTFEVPNVRRIIYTETKQRAYILYDDYMEEIGRIFE